VARHSTLKAVPLVVYFPEELINSAKTTFGFPTGAWIAAAAADVGKLKAAMFRLTEAKGSVLRLMLEKQPA